MSIEAIDERRHLKILVTGSRTWDVPHFIKCVLHDYLQTPDVAIMHGDCPEGADAWADAIAQEYGADVIRFPADWTQYGKRAGFVRNAHMVNQHPDICLAFIRDESKGATMTAELCKRAGVETWVYSWDSARRSIDLQVFNTT